MPLAIKKRTEGSTTFICPRGIINTDTASLFSEAMQELDYDGLDLTLDFSELDYITSAGLRVLLIVRKKLDEDHMRIINKNEMIQEIFSISV